MDVIFVIGSLCFKVCCKNKFEVEIGIKVIYLIM